MNLAIDEAWRQVLLAQSVFAAATIKVGTTGEIDPNSETFIRIQAGDLEHPAGNLHVGPVVFEIDSPALLDDPDILAGHQAFAAALVDLLRDRDALKTAFAATDITLLGTHLVSSGGRQEDVRWIFAATLQGGYLAI